MRRVALLSVILSLVLALAAPAGAVFATETTIEPAIASLEPPEVQEGELVAVVNPPLVPEVASPEEGLLVPEQPAAIVVEPVVETAEPAVSQPEVPISPPIIVTPPTAPVVTEPVTTPSLVIVTFEVSDGVEFVELYNQSATPIAVDQVRIQAGSGSEQCSTGIADSGYIMPDDFYAVQAPSYSGAVERHFTNECFVNNTIARLEIFVSGNRVQLIDGILLGAGKWGGHGGAWKASGERKTFTSLKQAGSFAEHYILVTAPAPLYTSDAYIPLETSGGLRIIEILPNSRSCAPDDRGNDCNDYIKLFNESEQTIDLAPFRLRTGSRSGSATVTTAFTWHEPTLHPERDELLLPAGEYFTLTLRNDGVPISLASGEGNVWLEDYYGLIVYESVSYQDMDLVAAKEKSWAYDAVSGVWRLGIPSPGAPNVIYVPPVDEPGRGAAESGLTPCGPGQYRSEETNRCRSLAVATSVLTPCREGQYRSEETNRCRSIATAAASVLKPCDDGQFRNPATNRCRKIASTEDLALADCGEARERNPETNRCRNVVAAGSLTDTLPFPVEKAETSAEYFAGWWVLGVVAALGACYGVWEWRQELRRLAQKATRFISGSK